ncbi:MAG: hypothetical protein ACI30D_03440 [Muribaculaceae bacterium]
MRSRIRPISGGFGVVLCCFRSIRVFNSDPIHGFDVATVGEAQEFFE